MKILIMLMLTLSLYADQCTRVNDMFFNNYINFIKVGIDKKQKCNLIYFNLLQIERECKFTYKKYKQYVEMKQNINVQCNRF